MFSTYPFKGLWNSDASTTHTDYSNSSSSSSNSGVVPNIYIKGYLEDDESTVESQIVPSNATTDIDVHDMYAPNMDVIANQLRIQMRKEFQDEISSVVMDMQQNLLHKIQQQAPVINPQPIIIHNQSLAMTQAHLSNTNTPEEEPDEFFRIPAWLRNFLASPTNCLMVASGICTAGWLVNEYLNHQYKVGEMQRKIEA
eukprot:Platyproteum_vivax@DN1064_c0_g1_i1.p1